MVPATIALFLTESNQAETGRFRLIPKSLRRLFYPGRGPAAETGPDSGQKSRGSAKVPPLLVECARSQPEARHLLWVAVIPEDIEAMVRRSDS
jgi:hypothetical protein